MTKTTEPARQKRASVRETPAKAPARPRNSASPDQHRPADLNGARSVDRTQLQLIIAGLTDGVIIVEPDQTIAWANEAALTMHGVASSDDLGRTVAEYRSNYKLAYLNNHVLEEGRYPIERVVTGEAFDDVVVEVAPAGEETPCWVHRIRSLVINDREGNPDCLVLILKDMTERYRAEDRFQKTFAANPAPAIICRLSDLRFVKVNQGFIEMTGFRRDDLLGRSTYEIDLLQGAERRELAIERLGKGETIPQMEAKLALPDGGSKWVILAGQPIEIGEEACMLFTFADLEPQKKAEIALRQSEEQFHKIFQSSPAATALLRASTLGVLTANDAFLRLFRIVELDVVGRRLDEISLWDDTDEFERFKTLSASGETVGPQDARLRTSDGGEIDGSVSVSSVNIGGEACLLMTILDVTQRRRSERELVAAIDSIMGDMSWFSRGVIEKLAELRLPSRREQEGRRLDVLTKREREILQHISRGATDAKIAASLKISQNTVRNHVAALYRKLGIHNRTEAAVWGHTNGLVLDD